MVKNKTETKSGLNVFVFNEEEPLEHDGSGDTQEEISRFDKAPTYDLHTKKLISNQASSVLLYLLFCSVLMFTRPFGAFYGTRHWLQEHTDFSVFAISSLSASASVITVYYIIKALYAHHAYHEKDVVIPGEGSIDDSTTSKVKSNQNKQKQKKN